MRDVYQFLLQRTQLILTMSMLTVLLLSWPIWASLVEGEAQCNSDDSLSSTFDPHQQEYHHTHQKPLLKLPTLPTAHDAQEDESKSAWHRNSAKIDWCEGNYEKTEYIAEYYNTISNVLFFIIPPIMIWLSKDYARLVDSGTL